MEGERSIRGREKSTHKSTHMSRFTRYVHDEIHWDLK